jgi:hypothetical protein
MAVSKEYVDTNWDSREAQAHCRTAASVIKDDGKGSLQKRPSENMHGSYEDTRLWE